MFHRENQEARLEIKVAKQEFIRHRRVDVLFSDEEYKQLLQLRSIREENSGRTVAINQVIRDLVDEEYTKKVEETLRLSGA